MEKGKQGWGYGMTDGLLLLAGFGLTGLLTALKLPFGLAPGGLSIAGAWGLAGLPGGMMLSLAALGLRAGFLTEAPFPAGWGCFPLLLALCQKGRGRFRVRSWFLFSLLAGVIFSFLFWRGGQALVWPEVGEVAVVAVLAWLLAPGFRRIGRSRGTEEPVEVGNDRLGLAFGLLIFLLYLTLSQISFWTAPGWQLNFNYCFFFLLLLVAGSGPGINYAPVLGLVFILAEFALGEVQPWLLCWMGGSGLLSVLLPLKGKGRAAGALLLPGAAVTVFWPGSVLWSPMVQAFFALLLFLAVPTRTLVRWGKFLAGEAGAEERTDPGWKRTLGADAFLRLRELGLFFQDLACVFTPETEGKTRTPKEELLTIFEEIAEANCLSCRRYKLCWQERFYQTYQELFTILGWAELGVELEATRLKGDLLKECVHKEALLHTVNQLMEQERTSHYWRRRFCEARQFLAERLAGVAGVITQLAEAGAAQAEAVPVKEKKLGKALRKAGVKEASVKIWSDGKGDHLRLLVEKKTCPGAQECRLVVAPLLSTALGRSLAVTHWECGRARQGRCLLALGPDPVFLLESAVVQLAKPGHQISGDSQRIRMIGDRLMLCLLSDGMGVGTAAARISQTVVRLLEELLAAGFPKKLALESLNTLLLLATPEEEFATLDLLLFDRLSGEVELFKVGSAPTYVKKGREVQVIRSTSLPIGIVPKVEPEYYRDFLADGDLVVMVSDGAATLGSLGEDWLLKALKRGGESAAGPLSRYLLELAKIEAGGEINDDLTIMVLQIKATAGALLNNF